MAPSKRQRPHVAKLGGRANGGTTTKGMTACSQCATSNARNAL
jgi:hypothetical protein